MRAVRRVVVVHCETSTGGVCDLRAIAAEVRRGGALLVADIVSSLGVLQLEVDNWDLDVTFGAV